jgi:hypothetical protein
MGLLLVGQYSPMRTKLTSYRYFRKSDPPLLKAFVTILVYVLRFGACQRVSRTMMPLGV